MTGESSMSDSDYLKNFASPEELRTFRASVEARRSQKPGGGWRELPNGSKIRDTYVLAGCFKCGRWIWVPPPASGACPVCNLQNKASGGQLRPATAEEEKAWFERSAAEWAKWKAEAPKRQAEVDEFNKRMFQDKGLR
jgi:hypothetical protein